MTQSDDARPLFVSREAITRLLRWPVLIDRLSAAYRASHTPDTSPRRILARAPNVWLRAQSAAPTGAKYMGAKLFGVGRERAVNHLIVLFDQQSGKLAALVDGQSATAFRTAATTAMAIDRLALQGPVSVAVLGSGMEARHHFEALCAVRSIGLAKVFSPTQAKREAFAEDFRQRLGVDLIAARSAREAVEGMSIVVAAARAVGEKPVLHADWLTPGQVIASIGSTLPEQREVDISVIEASDLIVCDMVDEVMEETGDMIAASAAGINIRAKTISLNDAMLDGHRERISSAHLPLYKSVGSGLQDIVVAELALDLAIEEGSAETSGIHLQTRRPAPSAIQVSRSC